MRKQIAGVALAIVLGACGPVGVVGDEADDTVDPNEPDPWSEVEGTEGEGGMERGVSSCKQRSGMANGNYTRLTYAAVAKLAKGAGIGCGSNLVKAVAVAAAESGRYQYAYLQNTGCSIDRGIWQINSYYHPKYSSFDLSTNAKGMVSISSKGTNWSPWWAYKKGMHKQFMSSACAAVKTVCGRSYC
jgi:hypothetical protein